MEENKKDIAQKLINSANALAAAADALLEVAADVKSIEKEMETIKRYLADQEKMKQKILQALQDHTI